MCEQYTRLHPLHPIAVRIQKILGMRNIWPVERVPWWQRGYWQRHGHGGLIIIPDKTIKLMPKNRVVGSPLRKILAHEIAHAHPAGLAIIPRGRGITEATEKIAHGATFKSTRRQVEKVMQRAGIMKELRKLGYALEDPKYVKTRFAEMKQHKVPFRTRMQVLSREYGGRGGYTSEELHKIVTGKSVDRYYIFPFVKGAPPEVNRILERTYRRHREAGDTKVAAAIAAWNKVKQAGYVKVTKPSPVWVKRGKRRYKMLHPVQLYTAGPRRKGKPRTEEERRKRHKKLHPMKKLPSRGTGLDYGIGRGLGAMTERGVRGLWRTARRHPRIVGAVGAFGAGALTQKELEKRRRKRIPRYQLQHFTPNIPAATLKERVKGFRPREVLKQRLAESKLTGKMVMRQTSKALITSARLALVTLVARELFNHLSRKGPMPEIRPDIELSNFSNARRLQRYAEDVKLDPNIAKIGGGIAAGVVATKLVQRHRRREQILLRHRQSLKERMNKPTRPPILKPLLQKGGRSVLGGARRGARMAKTGTKLAIVGLAAKEILDLLAKRIQGETAKAANYTAIYDQTIQYASVMPNPTLQAIKVKGSAALRKTRKGAERGMLLWLLGFISAELLARGLTSPKKRHEVTFPAKGAYARIGETGERLPRSGFQPFRPTKTVREVLPKFKRPHRVRRGATVAAIPVAALLALRMSKRREGYAIGQRKTPGRQMGLTAKDVAAEAATRVRKAAGQAKWGFKHPKAVGAAGKIAKGTVPRPALAGAFVRRRPGTVAGVGLSLLALQALRRKRKRKQEGYSFRTAASKVARGASKVGGKVGRGLGAVSNIAIPAMIVSELWPRKRKLQPHPPVQTAPRYTSNNLVEMYPMKSQAQRRWMHAVKPKMAKKWERETPEGVDLPEKVSKHLLGVPVITLALIERLLNKRRSKRKKYAHPVALIKNIRELSRLSKSKVLGSQALKWFRDQATRMRTLESAAQPGQKVSIGGHFVGAKPWFKRAGDQWETAGAQVKDMLARGQLEKVKVATAAAAATGVVGHAVGKQRERARIRKAVG